MASPTATARMPTHGSWRPLVAISTSWPWVSMVFWGMETELVGLTTKRATMSWPVDMPPRTPPALLDRNVALPSGPMRISSEFSGPERSAAAKPAPISTPLTAGILIRALAMSASSLSRTGAPRPAGTPAATTSITAPVDEPALRTPSRKVSHSFAVSASGHQKGLFSTSPQSQRPRSIRCGPIWMRAPRIATPPPRTLRATAPAATRMAVSRALARPPPRWSRTPYFWR